MSATRFTKEWYSEKFNKTVVINGKRCRVYSHRTESRGGSWERGFRFYETKWAVLIAKEPKKIPAHLKRVKWAAGIVAKMKKEKVTCFSMDHGKSWHLDIKDAMKSKGKLKLNASSHGELAFGAIQAMNRRDFGPGFVWKR